MEPIVLRHSLHDGSTYQATFLPEKGMNLISFKKNEVEIIDQDTKKGFEERFGGLGPLIGPHFHRRNPKIIPLIENESLFPHIAFCKAQGILDPFSHGIARYAPWRYEFKESEIFAQQSGKDLWNGVSLASIEGQNFTMRFSVFLNEKGLQLDLSVLSDTDSVVGIHYYYRLPNKKGQIIAPVDSKYNREGKLINIPEAWLSESNKLYFDLNNEADFTFFPSPNPLKSSIYLQTEEYTLKTSYQSTNQENSWQLYHPKEATFVCIEPLSAQDPRHPNLTVSRLQIQLQISLPA